GWRSLRRRRKGWRGWDVRRPEPKGPPPRAPSRRRSRIYRRPPGALTSLPMHEWQVWFVAALLLFVAEMIAPGFWLLSVAVGSIAAGVVALVLPGVVAPALTFAAGTLLSPAGIRTSLLRHRHFARRCLTTQR